jgi:hypothetical protein
MTSLSDEPDEPGETDETAARPQVIPLWKCRWCGKKFDDGEPWDFFDLQERVEAHSPPINVHRCSAKESGFADPAGYREIPG